MKENTISFIAMCVHCLLLATRFSEAESLFLVLLAPSLTNFIHCDFPVHPKWTKSRIGDAEFRSLTFSLAVSQSSDVCATLNTMLSVNHGWEFVGLAIRVCVGLSQEVSLLVSCALFCVNVGR